MRPALIYLLLLLPATVPAQSILTPGKKALVKKWIRNETTLMGWYAGKDSALVEIGKLRTTVQKDKEQIRAITTVELNQSKSPWIDTTIAESRTLAPVYHSSYNGQRDMQLYFGKVVTGFYTDKINGRQTQIQDSTMQDYFDSNLYPFLIRWLPLQEGYRREIAIYDYNPAGKTGVTLARINKVEKGLYKSPVSGPHSVWKVTVIDELGSSTGSSTTYYIDRKNRQLWQMELIVGSRKMWVKRLE